MVCTPFNNININALNSGITTMSWVKREGKALIFMDFTVYHRGKNVLCVSVHDLARHFIRHLWVEWLRFFYLSHVFLYFTATTPSVMGIISKGTTNTRANSSELFQVRNVFTEQFYVSKFHHDHPE